MRSGIAQGTARGWGAACFLVLPFLLLGSCMSVPPPAAVVATDIFVVIDATQDLVGGEWDVRDDPNSRGCVLTNGGPGRTFSALRISSDPIVSVPSVTAAWEDFGYAVDALAIGPVTQLTGTADDGSLLIFRLSDRGMTLQGEGECEPVSSR